MPGDEYTVYATTYGSWATILPKGHQILKIDFTLTDNGWKGDIDVFGKDVGTPLPITGGPDGNLYYATFDHGGRFTWLSLKPVLETTASFFDLF